MLGVGVALLLLLTVGPKVFPFRTFSVLTASMSPTMPIGSLVVVTPVAANRLKVGDVITFTRPGHTDQFVTHRIVGIEEQPAGPVFITKGDANGVPDAWEVPITGQGWRAAFHVPAVGYLFGGASAELRAWLRAATVAVVAAWLLITVWRPAKLALPDPSHYSPWHP